MDGKGRAIDNIFIERFWRNIKYEKIYLEPSDDGLELYGKIKAYKTSIFAIPIPTVTYNFKF